MNRKELESINITRTYANEANKHKETLSLYGDEGQENTLSTSEKKEKHVAVIFVCMNGVNTSDIQRMNVHTQKQLYT